MDTLDPKTFDPHPSFPQARTLPEILWSRAEQTPDLPAFTELLEGENEAHTLSWAELDARASHIAGLLQAGGAVGLPVLLVFPPGSEFLSAFLGCLYSGVIPVPTYPPEPRRLVRSLERFRAIAADCDARFVLSTNTLLPLAQSMQRLAPELSRLRWLCPETELKLPYTRPTLDPQDLALLQYTSGSTGTPKGVMVSHRSIWLNCQLFAQAFQIQPNEVSVTWLPNYHDMGLIEGLLRPLYTGSHGVMMAPLHFLKRPLRWLEAISRWKAAVSGGPNFAYELCCERVTPEALAGLDLSTWRVAYNGAEPVRASTLERFAQTFAPAGFRSTTHWPGYGLAEATLLVSGAACQCGAVMLNVTRSALEQNLIVPLPLQDVNPDGQRLVSVGKILVADACVVDPDSCEPLPPDRVGELWLRGPSLASGYWHRAEETRQTFQAQRADDPSDSPGWLRTGDLAFLRPDGELFITGRRKDLIVIRGRNHYPQDLEQQVEHSHPALFRPGCSAAFSVDVDGEERVVLVLELQRRHADEDPKWLERRQSPPEVEAFAPHLDHAPDIAEVLLHVRQCLLEQVELLPFAVLLIKPGTIHKTSSGKIQRQACRRAFLEGQLEVLYAWKDPASATGLVNGAGPPPEAGAALPVGGEDASFKPVSAKHVDQAPLSSGPGALETPPLAGANATPLRLDALRALFRARIAALLRVPESAVALDRSFLELGLDSRGSLTLLGALEEALGRTLAPSLLYDHPSPLRLIRHLMEGSGEVEAESSVLPRVNESMPEVPIAVIGMACRFPGADSVDSFWGLLSEGRSATRTVPADRGFPQQPILPPDRSGVSRVLPIKGGFLEDVDQFDPLAFGLSPMEAERMDPQQRLMLEVTWEALADAALSPAALGGSQTGVFVGIANSDFGRQLFRDVQKIDGWTGTGAALSIAANRISYLLDCHGPSLAIDTACSSSLVAVSEAMSALRLGTCPVAIAGGVSLILAPDVSYTFARAGVMAPDGRCKTFDARADGYARGEGAGVLILKPLPDAIRDGDPIRAVLKGAAVGSNGRSNGLMAPNGESQTQVVQEAWRRSGLLPADAHFIETHGTGTALGDPVEVMALARAVGAAARPVWLGAVKTQVGHLEAAAGVAGLIKTILSVQLGVIPGNLNFISPNPHIPFQRLPFRLPLALTPWPHLEGPRRAGVSSFGFGGTNAHVVVQEAPRHSPAHVPGAQPPTLLPLSARSRRGLKTLAKSLLSQLERGMLTPKEPEDAAEAETQMLLGLVRTALGREALPVRAVVQAESLRTLRQGLTLLSTEGALAEPLPAGKFPVLGDAPDTAAEPLVSPATGQVWVFPGQGAQSATMARALYQAEPVFRASIQLLDQRIQALAGWSLVAMIEADLPDARLLQSRFGQPALFAVQVSLATLWRAYGVVPAAVVGHSMGEVAAAHVSGALELDQALRIILARGRLMQRLAGKGAMAAIELPAQEVEAYLRDGVLHPWSESLGIAAVNSASSCVISGAPAAVDAAVEALTGLEIYCKRLQVDLPGHSPLLDPLLFELEDAIGVLTCSSTGIPIVSSVTGTWVDGSTFDTGYWPRNLRVPVRFDQALETLLKAGHHTFVELSPHPALVGVIEQALLEKRGRVLASCRREDEVGTFQHARSVLWAEGGAVSLVATPPPPGPRVPLPLAPWERRSCRLELPGRMVQAIPVLLEHPLLGSRCESPLFGAARVWECTLWLQRLPFLADHRVQESVVFPATGYIELARAAGQARLGAGPLLMTELELHRALVLSPEQATRIQTVLRPNPEGTDLFIELYARGDGQGAHPWTLHATAKLGRLGHALSSEAWDGAFDDQPQPAAFSLKDLFARCPERVGAARHYSSFERRGIQYGPAFQGLREGVRRPGEACCLIELPRAASGGGLEAADGPRRAEAADAVLGLHPALLDACLQTMGMALPGFLEAGDRPYLPIRVERVAIHALPGARVWSWARVRGQGHPESTCFCADIVLANEAGAVLVEVNGLTVSALEPGGSLQSGPEHWHQQVDWEELSVTPVGKGSVADFTWLLCTSQDDATTGSLGARLATRLVAKGAQCVMAQAVSTEMLAQHTLFPDSLPRDAQWLLPGHLLQEGPGLYAVDPKHPEAVAAVLAEAMNISRTKPLQVLCLWGDSGQEHLEASPDWAQLLLSDGPQAGLLWQLGQQVGGVLHLAQALAALPPARAATLSLLTRGHWEEPDPHALSRPLHGDAARILSEALCPSLQGMLWALGRSLAHELSGSSLEHPSRWGLLADLDGLAATPTMLDASLDSLLLHLLSGDDEDQLRIRSGRTSAARLMPRPLSSLGASLRLKPEGTYWITGGTGGLGLELTRWLASRGARRIVLQSRSGLNATGLALQATLQKEGVEVLEALADVADYAQTAAAVQACACLEKPILGVIHAAGVVRPRDLLECTLSLLEEEARPKVAGAWVLDQLSRSWPLDFFVTFGSASASWGSRALSCYAAANGFLESLVARRIRQGLPGLNVAWAMWGDTGMATQGPLRERLLQAGLRPMPSNQALWVLEQLLVLEMRRHSEDARSGETAAHAQAGQASWPWTSTSVVAALDRSVFREVYESQPRRRLLAAWPQDPLPSGRARGDSAAKVESSGIHDAGDTPLHLPQDPHARAEALHGLLLQEVARALGLSLEQVRPEVALGRQGLDSLSAVRLRSELERAVGVRLSVLQLLTDPGLRRLTTRLMEALDESVQSKKGAGPGGVGLEAGFDHAGSSEADWSLDPEFDPGKAHRRTEADGTVPRVILLTGATGFLGAEVLGALSQASSPVRIMCLARAKSDADALERVLQTLRGRGITLGSVQAQIEGLAGDLSLPLLGVGPERWERLAGEVESILHVGYWVNFLFSYNDLSATNVQGLKTLIRLAGQGWLKPLHFVSSFSVFLTPEYAGKPVLETDPPFPGDGGYRESKRRCEQLILDAAARGLPVSISRPPFVSWHSQTGDFNPRDFLMQLILGCMEVEAYPEVSLRFQLAPVEWVAKCLASLVLHPSGAKSGDQPPRLHLLSDVYGTPFQMLIQRLRDAGASLEPLPLDAWLERIRRAGPSGALHSFFSEENESQGRRLLEVFSSEAVPSEVQCGQAQTLLAPSAAGNALQEAGVRALLLRMKASPPVQV